MKRGPMPRGSGFRKPELPRTRPVLIPRSEPARARMMQPAANSAVAMLDALEPITAGRVVLPHDRKAKTVAEQRHMDRVAAAGCVLCWVLGQRQLSRIELHHPREGQGGAQRAPNWLVFGLCGEGCHRGRFGIHGDRSLLRIAKVDELDLLALTLERVYA